MHSSLKALLLMRGSHAAAVNRGDGQVEAHEEQHLLECAIATTIDEVALVVLDVRCANDVNK